ncbi:YlmH/Sll1252 family protein [Oribacterium sp. WCC10]|uniref:YlmH/Sll1252 family protein n=1 Tax=Oribacterium sp. WCC10 TaxID=1855343 RepID=UPI0008F42B81|nr:YlmH/Sll1252 family protein [Oribacterium sp. WCC10]SFG71870.1 RNA-binding protein YlmH, contains S4-like domain [Oribacterium sp. WCC10]
MEHNNYLEGHIRDLSERAFNNDYLTHTGFLSLSELAFFYSLVQSSGISPHMHIFNGCPFFVYGGHEDSERSVICFLPSYMTREDFHKNEISHGDIVNCIHITPLNKKFADELTHRDYLGALMNLGLERDLIGDILVDEQSAFVFVLSEASHIISEELSRVKHTSVQCNIISPSECTVKTVFSAISGSVASERLDAILSMVFHLSRGKSLDIVKSENVFVDGRILTDPGYTLKPGERVSVRGYGKFIYEGTGNSTKKGRFYANVSLYS